MAGKKTVKPTDKKDKPKLISTTEFAKLMGVTRQAILQAIQSGRIDCVKVNGQYGIDPIVAQKQFIDSKERQVFNDPNANATQIENIAHMKRIRLGIQIQQDKLNLEKSKGELVSVRDVNDKLFKMAMEIRQAFQMLPSQVIDDILAASTRNAAHEILSQAIDRELDKLSKAEI